MMPANEASYTSLDTVFERLACSNPGRIIVGSSIHCWEYNAAIKVWLFQVF